MGDNYLYIRNGIKFITQDNDISTIKNYSEVTNFTITIDSATIVNNIIVQSTPTTDVSNNIIIPPPPDNQNYNEIPFLNLPPSLKFNPYLTNHARLVGYHRSGWEYVLNILSQFYDANSTLIFDDYVDATFLWEGNHIYTTDWFGIIHHPPVSDEYSIFNANNIIKNPNFISSLQHCRGLIVFTNYLKKWFKIKLQDLGFSSVPIFYLDHPTLFVDKMFNPALFSQNTNKKVIQIGGWLRDSYAIYRLYTPPSISKAALKGRNMDMYFKPSGFDIETIIEDFYLDLSGNISGNLVREPEPPGNISGNQGITENKYVYGFIKGAKENDNSVDIINELSNEQYDELLEKNIVFLYLVNASACNTLIECIVRNTPILINKIEPVVEMLGEDYPLYYDTIEEATNIMMKIGDNGELLTSAYLYIKNNIDKNRFTAKVFLHKFKDIMIQISS